MRVWPLKARPTLLRSLVLLMFALLILNGMLTAVRQQEYLPLIVGGVFAPFAFVKVVQIARAWRLRSIGSASGRLDCSLRGVGFTGDMHPLWFDWSEISNIQCRRRKRGGGFVLRVESSSAWTRGLVAVILVELPCAGSAAHVRNTLRRHHRAWQKANAAKAR